MSQTVTQPQAVAPAPARGILGVPGRLPFTVRRFEPPPDLRWIVDRFWVSAWDLAPGRAVTARVLPHATVNLTLESGELVVTGVAAGVFTRTLRGVDRAFGVKFTPGAFRRLTEVPIGSLSGSGQPATGVLADAHQLAARLRAVESDDARAEIVTAWLRGRGVRADDALRLVQRAHAALVCDPSVHRVEQVARQVGVSTRTLQRLFADHLGVTPGWVLRRGRLHVAAERVIQLASTPGGGAGWADVAAELGYADQSHFTHDFRRVLGTAPGSWAAELVSEHAG